MQPSPQLLALIKHFEGLRLNAYRDATGVWTLGYGSTKNVKPGDKCTPYEAELMLRGDLAEIFGQLTNPKMIVTALQTWQVESLADFAYNLGMTAFEGSTMRLCLNAGNLNGAVRNMLEWSHAQVNGKLIQLPGLVIRRKTEAAIFQATTQPQNYLALVPAS